MTCIGAQGRARRARRRRHWPRPPSSASRSPSTRPRRRPGRSRRPSSTRRGRGADRGGAGRDRGRHDRHRRPGPDVPQGDRQGAAPQRRGRGRPGQGDRARRADHRRAAEGRPLAVGVDAGTRPSEDARQVPAAPPALQGRDRPHRRAARSRRPRRTGCSSRRPTSTSSRRGKGVEGDTGQGTLKEAKVHAGQGVQRRADRRPLHRAGRLRLPRGALAGRRDARQPGHARALRLDARRRPRGAAPLDLRRPRCRAAGRDGLDDRTQDLSLKPRDRRGVLVRYRHARVASS